MSRESYNGSKMETKKISINDIVVLNESDMFDNGKLSKIMGGNNSEEMGCTCKCDLGNCYEDDDDLYHRV